MSEFKIYYTTACRGMSTSTGVGAGAGGYGIVVAATGC